MQYERALGIIARRDVGHLRRGNGSVVVAREAGRARRAAGSTTRAPAPNLEPARAPTIGGRPLTTRIVPCRTQRRTRVALAIGNPALPPPTSAACARPSTARLRSGERG